ncbi:hypothetical protein [Sphingosinicella sp. LY1275]|uniref:hypothetical protein n=1 Tax=Sphingosinicella sp. LY1275 TaxID=3095379 RepID=UPI002ADEC200|nr:hypothetical protein [Sphingosinicella sp. LY1275]MEA1015584.1 hypothetical protein [Sphingosinicella sp. LY1275]
MTSQRIKDAVLLAMAKVASEAEGTAQEEHANSLLGNAVGRKSGIRTVEDDRQEAVDQIAGIRRDLRTGQVSRRVGTVMLEWWERELIRLGGNPVDALGHIPDPEPADSIFLTHEGVTYAAPAGRA